MIRITIGFECRWGDEWSTVLEIKDGSGSEFVEEILDALDRDRTLVKPARRGEYLGDGISGSLSDDLIYRVFSESSLDSVRRSAKRIEQVIKEVSKRPDFRTVEYRVDNDV